MEGRLDAKCLGYYLRLARHRLGWAGQGPVPAGRVDSLAQEVQGLDSDGSMGRSTAGGPGYAALVPPTAAPIVDHTIRWAGRATRTNGHGPPQAGRRLGGQCSRALPGPAAARSSFAVCTQSMEGLGRCAAWAAGDLQDAKALAQLVDVGWTRC
jgi:hypothetical protein